LFVSTKPKKTSQEGQEANNQLTVFKKCRQRWRKLCSTDGLIVCLHKTKKEKPGGGRKLREKEKPREREEATNQ